MAWVEDGHQAERKEEAVEKQQENGLKAQAERPGPKGQNDGHRPK